MVEVVHLNTAGAGLMSQATSDAITSHLQAERQFGAYEAELRSDGAAEARLALAELVGADKADVALFDSGTRAWLSALNGLRAFPAGSRIWITPYEYAGNLLALQALARRDRLRLEVIPLTPEGDLDTAWMTLHGDASVRLVCLVHVPSACGIVLPIDAVGAIVRACCPAALYAVDACQSVGQLPLDVCAIGCDLLTAAGRKFLCGPRGTGFAVVSAHWRAALGDHPLDLHSARAIDTTQHELLDAATARRLETSELNVGVFHGLACAAREARAAGASPAPAVYRELCARLRSRAELELILPGTRHSGILSLTHRRLTPAQVVDGLRAQGINTWRIDGSHTPLYMVPRGIDTAVRLSVHSYTTRPDLDRLEAALDRLDRHTARDGSTAPGRRGAAAGAASSPE